SRILSPVRSPHFPYTTLFRSVTIKQAIQNFGLEERPLSTAVLENIKLYLEVHIEQGKILESNEVSVGNVTGIAGPLWLQFTLKGDRKSTRLNSSHVSISYAVF